MTPTRLRRWFRFSLRSLFVLVTLAAIGMGWVAYERRQSRREAELAEQLTSSNRHLRIRFLGRFDHIGDPHSWWRETLSNLCGSTAKVVYYLGEDEEPFDLAPLSALQHIELLSFDYGLVRD